MRNKKYSTTGKKLIAASLAAAMCFSGAAIANNTSAKTEAADISLGDLNDDGKINLNDAKICLKLSLGIGKATPEQTLAGDLTFDGKINLLDAKKLLEVALGISELPTNPNAGTTTEPPKETNKPTPTPYMPPEETSGSVITPQPVPTSIPLPTVEPGEVVTGTAIESVENGLNGATYDAVTGVYTFTDENKSAKRGIKFSNPWAGREDLKQTVISALPKYLKDAAGKVRGIIKDDKVVSIDGKTVYGDIVEKDGYISVCTVSGATVTVTDEAAEATGEIVEVMTGTAVEWNVGMLPIVNTIDTTATYNADYKEFYARPDWSNGVSISFWCKYDWASSDKSDGAPMLVIKNSNGCDTNPSGQFSKTGHTGDFAVMVRLNGGVSFEGDETGNCFQANNNIAGVNGEWNYYTVTFANDWITVYVNGQELVYNEVEIDKDKVGFFNNGFLTRYNPIYQVTKDEVGESDVRQYLKKGWTSEQGQALTTLDKECCIIGNDRYNKPDAVTLKKNQDIPFDLLVDLLVKDKTEIWFGSTSETQCNCLTSKANTGVAEYSLQSGTQLTDVTCYYSELTASEVAANYAKEYAENEALFAPKK